MKSKNNIIAFTVIGIWGAVFHFIYEWSGNNLILGYFFPINESTWEHLKLLYFPTVIFSFFEYIFIKTKVKNYVTAVVISLITGMLSIIFLFYGYSGFLGYNIDFINILIFYIALIIMLVIKNKLIENKKIYKKSFETFFIFIGFLIALLFIFFTYNPPALGVFSIS